MDSRINLIEAVRNKQRKFGANLEYFPCKIELLDGTIKNALFTMDQLEIAMDRADANPEDFVEKKNWLSSIFGF